MVNGNAPIDILCNMADLCVVSEILCYLQNYSDSIPRALLITNISGFYNEVEIVDAKNLLFTTVAGMKLAFDDLPRNKQRKSGDNKRRLDAEDIVTLLEYVDMKRVELPVFVAKKLEASAYHTSHRCGHVQSSR